MDEDRERSLARLLWLERIATRLPGALMSWDREHGFTLAVGAAFTRPNLSAHELLGKTFEEYLRERAPSGERAVYEHRFGEKWYEVHTEPLPEADGSIGGVLALALDVTDRKRAEEGLRDKEALLRLAASEAPMLFQTRDAELRLTSLTGKLVGELGIDAARAIGTRFELFPGTDDPEHPMVRAHYGALQGRAGDAVHFEVRGRVIEARVEPLHNQAGGTHGTVSVWFDVTEARRAEQLLRQHYTQLELAASHTPSILWAANADGVVTTLTGRAVSVLGWNVRDMIGKPMHEALRNAGSADPARPARLLAPLQTGEPASYETTWGDRSFTLHVKPVKDAGGNVSGVVGIAYDTTEQRRAQEQSAYLANYDPLTGLPNRALLKELLAQGIALSRQHRAHAAVVAIDLDHFKRINETLGLDAGDAILATAAQRLQQRVPEGSTLARSSGDEFIVIVPEMPEAGAIVELAHGMLEAFEAPFEEADREVFVRASAGVSIYPADGERAETLLARADAALVHAKQQGRNNVQFFHPAFQAAAVDRLQLETDLRHAIERNQLRVHYQPIVDIAAGRIIGVEALVRWQHPERGLLDPETFITFAEESGLIVSIGEWVLRTACEQAGLWVRSNRIEFVSVNVSARQFEGVQLVRAVTRVLQQAGLDAERLELEFTESAVMRDRIRGIELLKALRAAGVRIGIDDFGTGYSSLAYLKQLPLTTLKIDRLFVRDIATSPYDAAIARAIIALAQSVDLRVIAEGVENRGQVALLDALGCKIMQGFLFSKPLPADEFAAFVDAATPSYVPFSAPR